MAYVASGEFDRDMNYIDDRVTVESPTWPVAAGKYRLIAARACPWAHRAVITRRLLGLESAISQGLTGPTHDWQSWTFDLYEDSVDPVLRIGKLRDAYLHRFPNYPKGITVPALVDIESKAVVTNDFRVLVQDFATEWSEHHREGAPDLYPTHQREEIDQLTEHIFSNVNNGVYRAGFAGTQEAYEKAFTDLFRVLDELEERLSDQRYLLGEYITFADVFLYPTLIRFDMVYHNHFKCNRNKITEMPNLWGYLRDLFQTPGFGDTTNFQQIKDHYYLVHQDINPTGVVPVGPDVATFRSSHGREKLGGSPFGDGTPPQPIAQIDTVPGDERL